MKSMRIKRVGERFTNSYEEWTQYLSNNKQYTILKKKIPMSINNLKSTLDKLDDKFLGKFNLFHDVSFLKTKTKEIYEKSKRFINIKEYQYENRYKYNII